MKFSSPGRLTCAVAAVLMVVGCSEDAVAPEEQDAGGGGEIAAAPAQVALGPGGLSRHVESFAGSVPGLSNFSLTLTCPNKMFAVSGGHDVGADDQAAQFLVSKPAAKPNRWTFVVFNPHATARPFEVFVICLR